MDLKLEYKKPFSTKKIKNTKKEKQKGRQK